MVVINMAWNWIKYMFVQGLQLKGEREDSFDENELANEWCSRSYISSIENCIFDESIAGEMTVWYRTDCKNI